MTWFAILSSLLAYVRTDFISLRCICTRSQTLSVAKRVTLAASH